MNRTTMVRRALLAGAAALTTLGLAAACGGMGSMDHGGSAQPTTSSSSGKAHNDADVTFAQMMIPHHQQAVEMATLAETRASDPEIKQIAAKIKAAQAPEITTLTGWLTAWGMPTAQAGGHNMPGMSTGMPGMMSDAEMADLKAATGADFDRMFARMMIAHHNGAIQSATDEQANGSDAQAKALAAAIKQTQTTEVATLQAILNRL
jgi:uncharacterized protein (DUF305 family)